MCVYVCLLTCHTHLTLESVVCMCVCVYVCVYGCRYVCRVRLNGGRVGHLLENQHLRVVGRHGVASDSHVPVHSKASKAKALLRLY